MTLDRRAFVLGASAAGLALSLPAAVPTAAAGMSIGGLAFGSTWRVVLPDMERSGEVTRAVEAIVLEIDAAMSPYLLHSELTRFNRSADTEWQVCSAGLGAVVAESLAVAALTDGAFDPTVGPLVNRYGFGPIHANGDTDNRNAGGRGTDGLSVQVTAIRKSSPDLTLDLCGVAKGYALDRIAETLGEMGVTQALIELGGEVRALGRHPAGRQWQVGIEQPAGAAQTFQRIVTPGSLALATSGLGAQGFSDGKRRASHIIDPHTARPVDNPVASVSVLADTAMRADALATALMVLGIDAGADLAERKGITALFLVGEGPLWTEVMTGEFSRHVLA